MSLGEGRETDDASTIYQKADIVNRIIARFIDILVVAALSKLLPPVGFFAAVTYLLIADGFPKGGSIGKRLIGLKTVVPMSSHACSFRDSIIRNFPLAIGYLLFFVPYIGWVFTLLILVLEGLLVIGNERGMRIGDELAKTQVLDI
jgi:uncharacterized RDD family membrane protein YckC